MKYKVLTDKKTGETRIDYYKVDDKLSFRYEILRKLLSNKQLFVLVDTNLIIQKEKHMDAARFFEGYLTENKIPYEILPTENNQKKKIMGIPLKKDVENAYLILFLLSGENYTEDFFKEFLGKCDAFYGINPNRPFDEICKDKQKGYITDFFYSEDFEQALYDSNFISTMRLRKGVYTPSLFD